MISRDVVRTLFFYEPPTGWLIRRTSAGNSKKGDVVGRPHNKGHLQVNVSGKTYQVHRLVWLYHFGWLPEYIDHINNVPFDNRLENLRPVTMQQNNCNSKMRTNNKSGFKGVHKHSRTKWRAIIAVNGSRISLGLFNTPEAAHVAYCEASAEHHGEYGRVS